MGETVVKTRTKGTKAGTRTPAKGRGILWPIVKWALVAGIWATVGLAGVVGWYALGLPDLDEAVAATRRPTVQVVSSDGAVLASFGDLYGRPVTVAELPPAVPQAVLSIEDRRFYDHFGLDVFGLARAMVANIKAGAIVQGGSTITQQAAKNLFLTPARTIERKVQELLLALWLKRRFSKDEILAIYLNRVYFGAGAYGIDAAAKRFFGRPASRVTLYQAAMLAGLLKAPSRYNPVASPERADGRARQVLNSMVAAGYLSDGDVATAVAEKGQALATTATSRSGRYFADWVAEQVPDFVMPGNRDVTVRTTLDAKLQRLAERHIADLLAGPGSAAGVSQAALVAMTPDGAVRAMVGGRDYRASQFNRATQALRQPGSVFKPVVYLAGLEAGLRPETRMIDEPVAIDGWRPRSFSGTHAGEMTLGHALSRSVNSVAVKVYQRAGRKRVADVARRLGITRELDPAPSLALGTAEVSLLELTAVYAAFANGGSGVWPYGIAAIEDGLGRGLYARTGSGPGRVVDARHAAAMSAMLTEAVRSGTGRAARIGRPVAGKTGTSQNFRDAWFVGYSAELVTGVWLGNDDGRPMKSVTGGGLPARLWGAFMADAHGAKPMKPLAKPVPTQQTSPEPSFWDKLKNFFGGQQ